MSSTMQMAKDTAFRMARKAVDDAGYGWMIGDDKVRELSDPIAQAVVKVVVEKCDGPACPIMAALE